MLEELAKHHKEWIKMVRSLGGDDFTEDIVQEMYLKIYNKNYNIYNDKGKLNKFYIYLTLRSILVSYFRERSKVVKIPIEEMFVDSNIELIDSDNIKENEEYHKLTLKINEEINKWHWYDREMFEIYRHSGLSIRKIASETNISWVSIFNTLKDCKGRIKEKLIDDYNNYKNEIK